MMHMDEDQQQQQRVQSEVGRVVSSYTGTAKLQRLHFIVKNGGAGGHLALRTLLAELRRSDQAEYYRRNVKPLEKEFADVFVDEGEGLKEWMHAADSKLRDLINAAENELRSATASMIKESIRLTMAEISNHYINWGKLEEAQKELLRSRDYCSTPAQHCSLHLQLMVTSLHLGYYSNVASFVHKVMDISSDPAVIAKTRVASALHALHDLDFAEAATKLLSVGADLPPFSEVLSLADVGLYGSLCALATMDRSALKKHLFENKVFLQHCVLGDSQLRTVVQDASAGRFKSYLTGLRAMLPRLNLDIYLSAHAHTLHTLCLQQLVLYYFSPFSLVTFDRVTQDLGMEETELLAVVVPLIQADRLPFKVCIKSRQLARHKHTTSGDLSANYSNAVHAHLQTAEVCLLRFSLLEEEVFETGSQGVGGRAGGGEGGGMGDLSSLRMRPFAEPYDREDVPMPMPSARVFGGGGLSLATGGIGGGGGGITTAAAAAAAAAAASGSGAATAHGHHMLSVEGAPEDGSGEEDAEDEDMDADNAQMQT